MIRPPSRGTGRRARLRAALLLFLIPGLAGILLARWPRAAGLENLGLDTLFVLRGPGPAPPGVCVVGIDEDSYQVLGLDPAAPWPRALHAKLVRTLAESGARSVAFDVLFEEARDPDQDAAFASALAETGIVVLGSTVDQVDDPRFRQARLIEPYGPFTSAAAQVGDVNLPTDRDGVIRRTWLEHDDRPGLALAAVEVATRRGWRGDANERVIDYYGPARHVRTVSVYQALDPEQYLPPGFFKDKVVFVGLSQAAGVGPAAKDAFLTPFRGSGGQLTYGVEIHATLAANLLEGRRIDLLRPWLEAALLLLVPLLATATFLLLRPLYGVATLLALIVACWAAAHLAFTRGSLWTPAVILSVQMALAWVVTLVWSYLTTVRERERIKAAFSYYLSPEMIRRIAADPASLNLGGEEIVATAVFTDIAGFTPLAEKLTAPQTAALLNKYFSDLTRHIFDAGGTLIKYIGDAVFAIWGAPLSMEDHALQACRAALAMSRAGEPEKESDAAPRLVTRVGVHTGPMLVGNLGSKQRFDYTAIGDAVNLAARLEGLNKAYGTRVLVSGETLARAGTGFVTRSLGRARVVGRSGPVEVHELLGLEGEATRPHVSALARFARALADFEARRLPEAAAGFREVISLCGGQDRPSEFFLGVLRRYEATPPPPDWDGVVDFEGK